MEDGNSIFNKIVIDRLPFSKDHFHAFSKDHFPTFSLTLFDEGDISLPQILEKESLPSKLRLMKCSIPECDRKARFHFKGDRDHSVCSRHRKNGMGRMNFQLCEIEECGLTANYGFDLRIRCKSHAEDGMVYLPKLRLTSRRTGRDSTTEGNRTGRDSTEGNRIERDSNNEGHQWTEESPSKQISIHGRS